MFPIRTADSIRTSADFVRAVDLLFKAVFEDLREMAHGCFFHDFPPCMLHATCAVELTLLIAPKMYNFPPLRDK